VTDCGLKSPLDYGYGHRSELRGSESRGRDLRHCRVVALPMEATLDHGSVGRRNCRRDLAGRWASQSGDSPKEGDNRWATVALAMTSFRGHTVGARG
jgi:hypothetical protein